MFTWDVLVNIVSAVLGVVVADVMFVVVDVFVIDVIVVVAQLQVAGPEGD